MHYAAKTSTNFPFEIQAIMKGQPIVLLWLQTRPITSGHDLCHSAIFRDFLYYVFIIVFLQVLSSMTSAAILKRHLMVWKIFAPKFVFEGAGFLVVSIVSIFMFLFVIRIHSGLEKWIKKLESKVS